MAANANERARIQSKAGLLRELQVPRDDNKPHPSRGGSPGYGLGSDLLLLSVGLYTYPTASAVVHRSIIL